MPFRALVTLAGMAIGLAFVALFTPERPDSVPKPPSMSYEAKGWPETRCDRCRRPLTADPQDGCYLIGGQPYWLHKACVEPVVKAARR